MGAAAAGSFKPPADGEERRLVTTMQFWALVDTGATNTCLSQSVIRNLETSVASKTEVQGVGGTHSANLYLVDLLLMYGDQHIPLLNREVIEFKIGEDAPFQALLGMDILGTGVLTMSLDGHFTLSH